MTRPAAFAHPLRAPRFAPLRLGVGLYLSLSSLFRLFLAARFGGAAAWFPGNLLSILALGLRMDLAAAAWGFLPLALWLSLAPERLFAWRPYRAFFVGLFTALTALLIYLGFVEYFFFDEFDARFNTVAVDYLLFPREVFVNIWQSYPVGGCLAATALATAALAWLLRRRLAAAWSAPTPLRDRLLGLAIYLMVGAVAVLTVGQQSTRFSPDRVLNELAGNGHYSFLWAAYSNDLDYAAYYPTLPLGEAYRRARRLVSQPGGELRPGRRHDLLRTVVNPPLAGRPRNLVLLLVESFGSEFWGSLGRPGPTLTPRMDALAKEGTLFTRIYACGNRTVRGMEGVLASFPPLPGDSIVKRDRSENVATLARTLGAQGYRTVFLYGGRGTFDSLRSFMLPNGYERFLEEKDFDHPVFTTVWGVSDEDLARRAVAELDALSGQPKPFFGTLLTVSNHKPFTYPDGRIPEVSEAQLRNHAVKYTDYALGLFFDLAKARPWYKDTLFAVVADHGARVYGKQTIPIHSYEIPLLIVDPQQPEGRRVDRLGSSLDVGPTLLGLLGISYPSTFFGRDLLRPGDQEPWVVMHHNRDIGFLRGHRMVVMGLQKTIEYYDLNGRELRRADAGEPGDDDLVRDATAVFEVADDLYRGRRYRVDAPAVSGSR